MLGARFHLSGDERQAYVGLQGGRQFNLGLLGSFFETLHGSLVFAEILPVSLRTLLLSNRLSCELNIAAQAVIAVGGFNFKDSGPISRIETSEYSAQVKNQNSRSLFSLSRPKAKRRNCGLVNDAQPQ